MAARARFLCHGETMKSAVIHGTTTPAASSSSYPDTSVLRHNPDAYYKPTNNNDIALAIDLGSAKLVDGLALWIHNYTTDHNNGGTATIVVSHSPDGTTWTQWSNGAFANDYVTPNAIFLDDQTLTPATKRYWKVELKTLNTNVEISGIFLYRRFDVNLTHTLPDETAHAFANRREITPSGRAVVSAINSQKYLILKRTHVLPVVDYYTPLQNAIDHCFGSLRQCILIDNDVEADTKLVRFEEDEIIIRQSAYQVYSVEYNLRQTPFVPAGSSY